VGDGWVGEGGEGYTMIMGLDVAAQDDSS
jgi:hypothetical protein